MCLQEMDDFKYFDADLAKHGYEGVFHPKVMPDVGQKHIGGRSSDGLAIFYDSKKFQLMKCQKTRLLVQDRKDLSHVAMLMTLRFKTSDVKVNVTDVPKDEKKPNNTDKNNTICIVTTHLIAKDTNKNLRHLQSEYRNDCLSQVLFDTSLLC